MDIMIRVPPSLKYWFDGSDETSCHGETIGECIENISQKFPGLKARLLDENGNVSEAIIIFLNGDNINALEGPATQVKEGDEISIIPLAAGG